MVFSDHNGIYVIATPAGGSVSKVTGEIVGKAREIGDILHEKVALILMGSEARKEADRFISLGADTVYVMESPLFHFYDGELFEKSLTSFFKEKKPNVLMFAADMYGKDLAPRTCASLRCGLTADVSEVSVNADDKLIIWSRPAMGDNIMADIMSPDSLPQAGTIHPGSFPYPKEDMSRQGEVIDVDPKAAKEDLHTRWIDYKPEASKEPPVEDAEIIVAGGRGIHSKEEWDQLHVLADLLGGTVGCTRPIVENGWEPLSRQIGQSGKSVHPHLYIALGISGAMQHISGVNADVIVSVNKDPHCPMMKQADYAIESDVKDFLPLLIKQIQNKKA